MDKEKLLAELQEAFEKDKKELGFKSSFDDIEDFALMEDYILSVGFVSNRFSRQMVNRMVDFYYSWVGLIHSWLMPNPQDLIFMNEHKKLSQKEKDDLFDITKHVMYFVRKSKRITFEDNKKDECKFIDELVEYYNKSFKKNLVKYHKKFEVDWEKAK